MTRFSSAGAASGEEIGGLYALTSSTSSSTRVSSGKSGVVDGVRIRDQREYRQAGMQPWLASHRPARACSWSLCALNSGSAGPVKIKLSRNLQAISREAENVELLRTRGGRAARQAVIETFDFLENFDG